MSFEKKQPFFYIFVRFRVFEIGHLGVVIRQILSVDYLSQWEGRRARLQQGQIPKDVVFKYHGVSDNKSTRKLGGKEMYSRLGSHIYIVNYSQQLHSIAIV